MITISPAERSDLAPLGKLRAAIMYTNPVIAARDPASGDLRGISVDLARELGRRADVPVELVAYETTAQLLGDLHAGAWDVAFTALASEHAGELDFTAPYLEAEGTYLVPSGSPLQTVAEVDRDGIRIAVSAQSSLDMHLSRSLQHARLLRVAGAVAAFGLFSAGHADVLAGVRQRLLAVAPELPGSRILDGRFMVIQSGIAIAKNHNAGANYLRTFIEDTKASGMVLQAIEKNGIRGASVASSTFIAQID